MKKTINLVTDKYTELFDRLMEEGVLEKKTKIIVSEQTIDDVVEFIGQHWISVNSFNIHHTSYGYKHTVEKLINQCVSNSELIIAMVYLGYQYRPSYKKSPNYFFNVSERSVKLSKKAGVFTT